jgi:hypothetical protein
LLQGIQPTLKDATAATITFFVEDTLYFLATAALAGGWKTNAL